MACDPMTATPDALLQELMASRRELDAVLAGLTDKDFEVSGMTGVWNGRQTLVHIARWDEVTTGMIVRDRFRILSGMNEYHDYEWWNLRWAEIDVDIPLAVARTRYEVAHEAIVRALRGFAPEEWTPLVRGWVREASLNHYRHHADTVRCWRAER